MKIKLIAAVALVASGGAALAVPASAVSDGTGCPKGYEVKSLQFVLKQAAPGFEDAIRAADENGDRLLCYKALPEPIPLFEPTFLFDDNNVPTD